MSWSTSPLDVASIYAKYEETFVSDINILLLLQYISLLSWDAVNRLADKSHSALKGNVKTTKFLQYLITHGEKGLRMLISALKESGANTQRHEHIRLAKKLEWELTGKVH